MSMARAIGEATGLVAGDDFTVRDNLDGRGPFLDVWRSLVVSRPTDVQIATWLSAYNAQLNKRLAVGAMRDVADEYLLAFIINQEFNDNTRLIAVRVKIAAWKAAHPGVVP